MHTKGDFSKGPFSWGAFFFNGEMCVLPRNDPEKKKERERSTKDVFCQL